MAEDRPTQLRAPPGRRANPHRRSLDLSRLGALPAPRRLSARGGADSGPATFPARAIPGAERRRLRVNLADHDEGHRPRAASGRRRRTARRRTEHQPTGSDTNAFVDPDVASTTLGLCDLLVARVRPLGPR